MIQLDLQIVIEAMPRLLPLGLRVSSLSSHYLKRIFYIVRRIAFTARNSRAPTHSLTRAVFISWLGTTFSKVDQFLHYCNHTTSVEITPLGFTYPNSFRSWRPAVVALSRNLRSEVRVQNFERRGGLASGRLIQVSRWISGMCER